MEPWAREFLDVWAEKLPEIAEGTWRDANRMWVAKYRTEDIAQMIHGGHAMMTEWFAGSTSEMRDDYLQTIIPGLVAQGESAAAIAAIDCAGILRILATVLPHMKPENRAQAMEAFIEWQSLMLQDMIRTGIEASNKP